MRWISLDESWNVFFEVLAGGYVTFLILSFRYFGETGSGLEF